MNLWDTYGSLLPDTLVETRLGARLGNGSSRTVFVYVDDPQFVVKQSIVAPPTDNLIEWSVWAYVRQTSLRKIFGNIVAVSTTGRYLIMERLETITLNDYGATPDVPTWLADVKPAAFGKSTAGVIKVMDYGSVKFEDVALIRQHWQHD